MMYRRSIGTAPPTQFQSVRLLCAAAAAPPRSLSATGPTLEVASRRPKEQSPAARTNQPPSHKYRWGSRCHRTPVAAGAGGCCRVADVWLPSNIPTADGDNSQLRVVTSRWPAVPPPRAPSWDKSIAAGVAVDLNHGEMQSATLVLEI